MEEAKDYFVKYLLVDGEIKKGDYFVNLNDDETYGEVEKLTIDDFSDYADCDWTDNCKKVELFLCSRLLKSGDKVMVESDKNITRTIDHFEAILPSGVFVFTDGTFAHTSQVFKVLGRVSPNAIWVNEGDEFDEKDTERYVIARDNLPVIPLSWGNELNKQDSEMYKDAYKIKCPTCKTFH